MSLFFYLYLFTRRNKFPLLERKLVSLHTIFYEKKLEKNLKYKPNLIIPKSMNEKIMWLIYHGDLSIKTKLTDKIYVKKWVSEQIGEQYVSKTYAICDSLDEVDWDIIPDKFVIKASHGCRMNIFVLNKEQFLSYSLKKAKTSTQTWLDINFADINGEIQYRDIPPKLLIEELTIDEKIKLRGDYSFHCFNGQPKMIENYLGKTVGFFYDLNGEQLDFVVGAKYLKQPFTTPSNFEKMIEIATILSKDFRYVRVDLREAQNKIIFGEMTFSPFAGCIPFPDKSIDFKLGEQIIL